MFYSRALRYYYTLELPYHIESIRKASNQKRSLLAVTHPDNLEAIKKHMLWNRHELSTNEWHNVRNTLTNKFRHISPSNVDAIILGLCSEPEYLSLAKNYVQHLRNTGVEPNSATLGRLLRVYNAAYHASGGGDTALKNTEQQDILTVCATLRERFENLDATTCENLIHGLVCTKDWRIAEELLEMTKLTSTPSVGAYTELIVKAFSQQEFLLGWRLLEEMTFKRKQPKCEIFITYLQQISKDSSQFQQNFERLLEFLGNCDVTISAKVVNFIEELAKISPELGLDVKPTKVSKGKCDACSIHLKNISITDAEYAKLSNSFLNKVLVRNDIFQKSTPEEVAQFKRYISKTAPYDCVIDGLNVAYSMGGKKSPPALAKLLANVVKYFTSKNKRLLVLGRKHMNSWPSDIMQNIRRNAKLFLTNNISQDDPFLLYATLKSGQSTDFCSRDLMRTHAFLLGTELRMIFRRWQQEHQYSLLTQTENGKIIIKDPIRYMLSAHKVQNTWHLPYKPEYSANPPEIFTIPEFWLCIKLQNKN